LHYLSDAGTIAFFQLLWAELAQVLAFYVPSKEFITIIPSADEYNNANHSQFEDRGTPRPPALAF
jgi:hypothetical protein